MADFPDFSYLEVGNKVLCRHGDTEFYYTAIVKDINNDVDGGGVFYTLHYPGWGRSHDQDIFLSDAPNRFKEWSKEAEKEAKEACKRALKDQKGKKRRSTASSGTPNTTTDSIAKTDKEMSNPSTPVAKKRKISSPEVRKQPVDIPLPKKLPTVKSVPKKKAKRSAAISPSHDVPSDTDKLPKPPAVSPGIDKLPKPPTVSPGNNKLPKSPAVTSDADEHVKPSVDSSEANDLLPAAVSKELEIPEELEKPINIELDENSDLKKSMPDLSLASDAKKEELISSEKTQESMEDALDEEGEPDIELPVFLPRPYNGNIGLPDIFKEVLRRDSLAIKEQHKLIKIPASITIDQILEAYFEACTVYGRQLHPNQQLTAEELAPYKNSFKLAFRDHLRHDLLYVPEVSHYLELQSNAAADVNATFTDKYGLVHFLRFLQIFCEENKDPGCRDLINTDTVFIAHDLINYLGENLRKYYFEDDYYEVGAQM